VNLPADTWVVVWDGARGFMRTGLTAGMALDDGDENHPPLTLTLSLNGARAIQPQSIQIRRLNIIQLNQIDMIIWPNLSVTLTLGEPWDWRSEPIADNTLNLLWGPLAPKARVAAWLPKFRPLVLILLIALLIETIGTNIEWVLLKHEKTQLTQEMERTFRQVFGESSVLVNPALQMQRNIAALRHDTGVPDEADFLSILDQTSGALTSLPSGSIFALHYEAGRLDIDLKLSQEAEIYALQQQLQIKGLSARLGDIRHSENGVETRMAIQTGGAL
jgi:type II secretion system protein L